MTVDVADADTAAQAENAASGTETDVSTETAGSEQTEEEELWQNRLMADVNDYLYVRASADADAEIVGKNYTKVMSQRSRRKEAAGHMLRQEMWTDM